MDVRLPRSEESQVDNWRLLFDLNEEYPNAWMLVGAQMVIVHAARYEISRPVRTDDTDVLVDIRTVKIRSVAQWLQEKGFELEGVSLEGIGHKFTRGPLTIDLLSIDHSGQESNRLTVRPARTVEVPGGRQAFKRAVSATIHVGKLQGTIAIPDWIGAIGLKARAVLAVSDQRAKHLRDLALLLGLPVDFSSQSATVSKEERKYLRQAANLITEEVWTGVSVGRSCKRKGWSFGLGQRAMRHTS